MKTIVIPQENKNTITVDKANYEKGILAYKGNTLVAIICRDFNDATYSLITIDSKFDDTVKQSWRNSIEDLIEIHKDLTFKQLD